MWSRRRLALGYVLASLLALTALFGCRAFEPEAVIVNNAPETYIIGAPAEEAGGFFHFHVYWYGTDRDGRVEQYVWALTDSSVQDEETLEDEEDSRFNPAENILTLDIGNWTTRTDSIFDFRVDQGAVTSVDKTFHIVAIDDRGDYDRTPARLYFLTNALGNPAVTFYKSADHTPENVLSQQDTVGFGRSFVLSWAGTTPNIRSFTPEILADRDTVAPFDDGLYGYKFRLPGDVECDDSNEDCWNPRFFDDSVNDSLSFFSPINTLEFNNGSDGATVGNVYRRQLASGVHTLLVNTIDVAGVEIPSANRKLDLVLNYDPDTKLLRSETDPFNPDDTQVYPYYQVFYPNGTIERNGLAEGDTVPNRAAVVFKAIGWDDPRDQRLGVNDYSVLFKGQFVAVGSYKGNPLNPFTIRTQYSWSSPEDRLASGNPINYDWLSSEGGADTLSFIVGPMEYEFNMVSVDEHQRVDGTPDFFHFYANYRPCVQAVEAVPLGQAPSYPYDGDCYDEASLAAVDTLYCAYAPFTIPGHPDWKWMGSSTSGTFAYNPRSGAYYPERPSAMTSDIQLQDCRNFEYELLLHGAEHPQESKFMPGVPLNSLNRPEDRMMAWQYEIRSESDVVSNAVSDGAGIDDIDEVTYNFSREFLNPENKIVVDDDGVWHLRIKVSVPNQLIQVGFDALYAYLESNTILTENGWVDDALSLTTRPLGLTTAQVIARDASNCGYRPDRGVYVYYQHVRVPDFHGESCTQVYDDEIGRLAYDLFPYTSDMFTKRYVIKVVTLGPDDSLLIYPPDPE